ncbi:MAG TPA: pantoate--beta-alanine ligase, partial [Desulfobacterales bacterium]|nr:pantoate--beta-alanine ligase [Desulfobacterales bacterium]
MELIETVDDMRRWCEARRASGKTIALVPTMGFLHKGHLELLRVGRSLSDALTLSIFVNPTQFGSSEDCEAYPRDPEGDLSKARH